MQFFLAMTGGSVITIVASTDWNCFANKLSSFGLSDRLRVDRSVAMLLIDLRIRLLSYFSPKSLIYLSTKFIRLVMRGISNLDDCMDYLGDLECLCLGVEMGVWLGNEQTQVCGVVMLNHQQAYYIYCDKTQLFHHLFIFKSQNHNIIHLIALYFTILLIISIMQHTQTIKEILFHHHYKSSKCGLLYHSIIYSTIFTYYFYPLQEKSKQFSISAEKQRKTRYPKMENDFLIRFLYATKLVNEIQSETGQGYCIFPYHYFWNNSKIFQLSVLYKCQQIHRFLRIIFHNRKMEVQSMYAPLFTPMEERTAAAIQNQPITFHSACSLHVEAPTQHSLKLICETLVLQQQGALPLVLQLGFDVKFEVLHQVQKDVFSQKMGIRLYDELERQLKIYTDSACAEQWCFVLGRRLNRKGFHEMFKPTRKLGKGNFATVYEAERLSDRAKFAVKAFIKQNCFSSKHGKESLINQLTVLRELNRQPHPNIIRLEGVYESDNSIYVVLQLLPGKTLFQVMEDRGGHFSRGEVKTLVGGLLRGLQHMHGSRIMHRDLKPQNIMLRGDSLEPVIVDFGLATHADVQEYLFFRCGTPGYVAPEIIKLTQSEHVEPVCDVFSLGAVFHILLSKKTLFAGTKFDEVYTNNKEFRMDLDGAHLGEASANARELLRKMLVLEPTGRITAREALSHAYFSDQAEEQNDLKISSPVLTSAGSYKQPQIKRMGLLFY